MPRGIKGFSIENLEGFCPLQGLNNLTSSQALSFARDGRLQGLRPTGE